MEKQRMGFRNNLNYKWAIKSWNKRFIGAAARPKKKIHLYWLSADIKSLDKIHTIYNDGIYKTVKISSNDINPKITAATSDEVTLTHSFEC